MNWWYERRRKSGYYDMGPVQIPPRPQAVVLTDRTDGSQWMISFETNPTRISITNDQTVIKRDGARVYDKDSGPVFDNGELMLVLDGGRLGVIPTPLQGAETYYSNELPYAREINDSRLVSVDTTDISVLHIGIPS